MNPNLPEAKTHTLTRNVLQLFIEFLRWIPSWVTHGAGYKGIISGLALEDLYNLVVTPDSFVFETTNDTIQCWVKGVASEGIRC